MGFPLCTQVDTVEAHFAILGIPYGCPYRMAEITNDQTHAPLAIRRESARLSRGLEHWDFDLGGPLFEGRAIRVVDCGDVPGNPADLKEHLRLAERVVRTLWERGAYPIVMGGDHGITIPVLRALDRRDPITLVQVDAHLDWRDEVQGVREGYSSPLRRASEMPGVGRIFQIGLRGQGSARTQEVQEARAYGAEIITAYEVHENGIAPVLERIPDHESYYLTLDADGLDPSVMPAVAAPAPGGLLFHQVRSLIHGLVRKGRLLGMDVVEITPSRDVNGISSLTAGQLMLNYMGAAVRAGYFD
jgi:agmatinase